MFDSEPFIFNLNAVAIQRLLNFVPPVVFPRRINVDVIEEKSSGKNWDTGGSRLATCQPILTATDRKLQQNVGRRRCLIGFWGGDFLRSA